MKVCAVTWGLCGWTSPRSQSVLCADLLLNLIAEFRLCVCVGGGDASGFLNSGCRNLAVRTDRSGAAAGSRVERDEVRRHSHLVAVWVSSLLTHRHAACAGLLTSCPKIFSQTTKGL